MKLFINMKAYDESTGPDAVKLINLIEREFGVDDRIIIVMNPLDSMITTTLKKFIQNAEPMVPGPFTGHVPITILAKYGYSGVMLNHSEFKLDHKTIEESIEMAKELHLNTLVCAEDLKELVTISRYAPDMIAYEPPELIGGEISVSTARPEVISEASHILMDSGIELVVGAGIKNKRDVTISRQLGAQGVLVSSGVIKSKEPIKVIGEMLEEVS